MMRDKVNELLTLLKKVDEMKETNKQKLARKKHNQKVLHDLNLKPIKTKVSYEINQKTTVIFYVNFQTKKIWGRSEYLR